MDYQCSGERELTPRPITSGAIEAIAPSRSRERLRVLILGREKMYSPFHAILTTNIGVGGMRPFFCRHWRTTLRSGTRWKGIFCYMIWMYRCNLCEHGEKWVQGLHPLLVFTRSLSGRSGLRYA